MFWKLYGKSEKQRKLHMRYIKKKLDYIADIYMSTNASWKSAIVIISLNLFVKLSIAYYHYVCANFCIKERSIHTTQNIEDWFNKQSMLSIIIYIYIYTFTWYELYLATLDPPKILLRNIGELNDWWEERESANAV
jgi:hypothetical protein